MTGATWHGIMGLMSELIKRNYVSNGENLTKYHMNSIVVDGIRTASFDPHTEQSRVATQLMVALKPDAESEHLNEDSEGYLDDTYYDVRWDGSIYDPVSYKDGDIDLDIWISDGIIVGFDSNNYDQVQQISSIDL